MVVNVHYTNQLSVWLSDTVKNVDAFSQFMNTIILLLTTHSGTWRPTGVELIVQVSGFEMNEDGCLGTHQKWLEIASQSTYGTSQI